MEKIKIDFDRFKKNDKEIKTRTVLPWQDLAANICKEFQISKEYRSRIFKMAKEKRAFLEGKVGNMRELKSFNPQKWKQLETAGKLGNYFLTTFRKSK